MIDGPGMRRVRVKFCGMTRAADARVAVALGADAIGLIFYPPSPRAVAVEQALAVLDAVGPLVTTVGVFVNPSASELAAVLARVPLDMLQFHGEEDPALCAGAGRPWIKAVGMREGVDARAAARRYAGARGLLLDTFSARIKGGTGRAFDWTLVPAELDRPVILAGGLDAGNVAQAIAAVRPYAVDVNGGVESSPGVKDARKMEAFMQEVERAQAA
jgi:phosphoribosylanthranilate isomerase